MAKVKHFNTGDLFQNKGLAYKVLGKSLLKAKDFVYKVSCLRCKELSPELEVWDVLWNYSNRGSYKKGNLKICFCNEGFKSTEDQLYRLVKNSLSNDVTFEGQSSKFKGIQTKYSLICNRHGKVETTAVNIRSHGGCGECSSEDTIKKRGLLYKESFEKITEGRRIDYAGWGGSTFHYKIRCTCGIVYKTTASSVLKGRKCRSCGNSNIKSVTKSRVGLKINGYQITGILEDNEVRDTKYILSCVSCSKDEELYPEGSITSNWGNLNRGQKCCGCSAYLQYSKEQVKVLLRRVVLGTDYVISDIDNADKLSTANLNLICPKGHEITSNYHNFKRGHRCKQCYILEDQSFGLYPKRLKEVDYLYLVSMGGFLKVGRSFDVCSRVKDYMKVFKDVTLLATYSATHKTIYEVEQGVLQKFNKDRFYPFESFGGYTECLYLSTYNKVLEHIEGINQDLKLWSARL